MAAAAEAGAAEGYWLRADRQTAGRGRLGRGWISRPGNLHASGLVRLRPGDPPAPSLALVAGIAMHGVLVPVVPGVMVKWPNDLLVGDAKLAGALLERHGDAVIVGIGIDLVDAPALGDRPTTSVAAQTGAAPDPAAVLETLADGFAARLAVWRREPLAVTIAAWIERAHPLGTALSVSSPDGSRLRGLFDGLDAAGALRLRLADGSVRVIHAADIVLGAE